MFGECKESKLHSMRYSLRLIGSSGIVYITARLAEIPSGSDVENSRVVRGSSRCADWNGLIFSSDESMYEIGFGEL